MQERKKEQTPLPVQEDEHVLQNVYQKDQTISLGVFMETILRCALIKFGHGRLSPYSTVGHIYSWVTFVGNQHKLFF